MKGRKRGLSLILTLSLILSLVGPLPARAADPVGGYHPDVVGAYLLPTQAANDSSFVRTEVLTADGLHVDGKFTEWTTEQNAVSVSGGNRNVLDPASTYMHSENRKWWTTYQWEDMGDVLKELLPTMQISATISASLTADRHMHFGTHKDLTDRAQAYLYAGYNTSPILKIINSSDDPDGVARTYTSSGVLTSGGTNLRFRMGATDCACGSSKVSKVYIYLTDTAAPTLTGIYLSDGTGEKISRTAYKGGETLYLTLEMSEPIRFADGVAHNDLKLNLDLISTSTGQSASSIEAGFYALTGSKLIFSYTVPSGQNMDYTVVSVEPGKQSWMTNSYDLKLLDENGSPMDNGSFTVNSLVTDLAGNPLSWASGRELDSRLYLDDVAPGYTRLNAQGNMTQGYKVGTDGNWPSDITPSATWAGVGDYLAFTLTLNEEVGLWTGDSYAQLTKNSGVTAVLNVKDGDGDSVEVGLSSVSYAMDNVNDVRNSTILTFQSFRPAAGMTLEDDAISIVSLEVLGGGQLGDPAGNMLSRSSEIPTPAEKLGLDVTPPGVTILDGQVNVKNVEPSGNGRYVTIPFTVTDAVGSGVALGQEVALGIDIATAFTVRYCITNNAAAPDKDNSAYRLLSYQQPTYPLPASTNDTYYLHICCSNLSWDTDPATGKMPLSVSITCQDYAGNTASDTVDYDIPFDQTGPEISLPTTFTVSGKGEISVPFSVSDSTHLASVTVQWNEAQASELLDSGNASASFSGTATYTTTDTSGSATLTVTAEDKAGNFNTKTQEYTYNLTTVNRYTLGGDPAVATGSPSLTLSAPGNQGGGGAEGNELVTVAVLGDGAGHYNLYTVAGSESGKNIFSATPDAVVTGITVTDKSVTLSGYVADGSGWATSSAYGDLPVTIFTLRESDWETAIAAADADGTVNVASLSEVESFHMKVLTGSSYTVTIGTPQDSNGKDVTAALVNQLSSQMVQTLTGLRVPITLTTEQDDAYALQDINYDASYIELMGPDKFNDPTIEVPGSKQFFQKPENGAEIVYPISVPLYNTSGKYQVKVSLTYLDGTTKEFTGPELYMYDLTSDEFGPTKLNQNNSASRAFRTVELSEDATQISLGFTGSSNATLYFDSFVAPTTKMNLYNTGPVSLDIWNESLGENAVHVKNYPALLNYTPLTLQMYSEGASSATTLYLMEGENIVRYRALLPNGNYTAAKTLIITVHNADPTFEVEFTPNGAGGLRMQLTDLSEDAKEALALNGRTLRLAATKSNMETSTNLITVTLDSNLGLDLTRAELAENWKDSPLLRLMDEYGNFTTVTVHPRYYIDILPPRVTLYQGSNVTVSEGTFCLTAVVSDYDSSNDCSEGLDLSSFALTFEYTGGTTVTTPLPNIIPNGTWTGSGAGYAGIYKVEDTTTYNDTEDGKTRGVDLLIYGQYPYGTTSDTVKITLSCQDNLGNACVDKDQYNHAYYTISSGVAYDATEPTVTASGGGGQVTLTSDLPIRVLDPVPTDTAGTVATTHTLPVYTNSATIQYEDVFGNLYTKDITASPFGENLTVALSETAATRGPVTLTATVTGEAAITAVTSENNGNGTISGSTATLVLASNDTVTITMGEETYTVEVTNIDNAVEPVTVAFYGPDGQLLNAGSGAESVTGPVTAALQCAELLVGETSHVFPIGSALGESYSFAVADQVGNTTTVTATLPWAVVSETGETTPPADTTAPEYTVSLYIQSSGGWSQINSYDSQIATGDLSLAGLASTLSTQSGQAVRLAFSIRDDSPVNLIVKSSSETTPGYDTASDPISGLTVTGSTLTWEGTSGNPVYVYLVDASGNAAAALTLTFPAVDKTPPTATVAYVSGNGEHNLALPPVRAYLVPSEADASDFTVLDTNLLKKDETAGGHQGQYYYEFQTNGSYIFRFSDAAGNIGTATATVNSIDTTELEVSDNSIQWLSRGQTYSNAGWTTAQNDLHTNVAVTAIINTNIALGSVTLPSDATGVTAAVAANQARITFSANAGALTLTLNARNGKTTEVTLDAVTCIDTAVPTVTVSGTGVTPGGSNTYTVNGSDKRSVELTFTTNEATAADRDSSFSQTHTYTAARNGEVSLTFTDQAGNVTQVTLNIQDLDDKLALSFSKNADGAGAVTDPADLGLTAGDTFYVKSTRDADITLGNASPVKVTKGSWIAFTLPSDPGLVILKAVDGDGNTLYAYLTVALPDTIPPVISLPSQIVYAQAGITQAEGLVLLREGVTVTDNRDSSLSFTVDTTGVTLITPGTYTVTYTATDASGNSSTATRTLVLTREAPITLTVNGQTVYQGSTLTLGKGTASLTLQGVDTPVYLALKPGYKTVAQMKLNAQVLLNGSYTGPVTANLTTTGFYTLYLRTQDRTEYVYYLYVKG
ncbi:immunoglobulin-like domain-containing protein [Pseudoflavonifractor sp.]|jgi:hypothetical protein|uniref:immunoglobulin-like domain-containing protein n=1 Tax=Pseudoflavonifractor sp. TaxID=1980281 RepID=UPI003D94A33B